MSHARLRNAVIAGGWPTKTMTATTAARRSAGGGALIGRGVGMADAPVSSVPTLLQPVIPCRSMASSAATAAAAAASPRGKVLTEDNVFVNLRKMEYAVRGPLLIRALEIEKELQKVKRSNGVPSRTLRLGSIPRRKKKGGRCVAAVYGVRGAHAAATSSASRKCEGRCERDGPGDRRGVVMVKRQVSKDGGGGGRGK